MTDNRTIEELFQTAIAILPELNKDEIVMVKDLFRGFEWNRIPIGNRTRLGIRFLAYIEENGNDPSINIKAIGKTKQNQQQYKKQ